MVEIVDELRECLELGLEASLGEAAARAADTIEAQAERIKVLEAELTRTAEMTDTEADFADGFELRARARTALGDGK